jgi:hypothetical protein
VIPDECRDQHGDPPYCLDGGDTGGSDPQDQHLLSIGDQYLGHLVAQITHARFWAKGNNAIDIVYDEGDNNVGGGGRVADIVVTSHGPRHMTDPTHFSHYSLLLTIQKNFGVACLQHSCDASVKPMSPLFAVTGAAAAPFTPLSEPKIATPTPVPSWGPTTTASAGSRRSRQAMSGQQEISCPTPPPATKTPRWLWPRTLTARSGPKRRCPTPGPTTTRCSASPPPAAEHGRSVLR